MAWKKNNKVYFASDSRLTINNKPFDLCLKISAIPIEVMGALDNKNEYSSESLKQSIGFCFSGDMVNAYLIKENLIAVLSSLQVILEITDVSMNQICKEILKIYKSYSKGISKFPTYGQSFLFITGFCPSRKEIKTFKFFYNKNLSDFDFKEILINNDEIEYMGSGEKAAKQIFKNMDNTPPFEVLKEVIDKKMDTFVGGFIQAGKIEYYNFYLCGVENYELDISEKIIIPRVEFLGIDTYKRAINWDEFHIRQRILRPFKNKLESYINEGYTMG